MRKLLLLLLVGILMLEGCTGLVNSDFTVQVTGTSGLKFIGDYMTATTSGGSTSKSVEGTVPATYTVSGSIVSVVFQKLLSSRVARWSHSLRLQRHMVSSRWQLSNLGQPKPSDPLVERSLASS